MSWLITPQVKRVTTEGLILSLDAGQTASYQGGSQWLDLSGSGNHATLVNGPTFSSTFGGNIAFNGTNQNISFGTPIVLSPATGFTIEVWQYIVVPQSSNTWNYFWAEGPSGFEIGNYFTNAGSFEFKDTGSAGTPTVSTARVDAWQHIMFGCDQRKPFLYANSVYSTNATLYRNTNLSISVLNRSQPSASGYYKVNQAIIRMYNRALTFPEVVHNFSATRSRFGV